MTFRAYSIMAVICLGCGENISNCRVKRNLLTEASRHIIPLVKYVFDEELLNAGKEDCAAENLINNGGKLCRKCFTLFIFY